MIDILWDIILPIIGLITCLFFCFVALATWEKPYDKNSRLY